MRPLLSTKLPSNRKFGFTFAVILISLGIYSVFSPWKPMISVACALAGATFFLVAAVAPQLLTSLNRAWFALGELLGRIVSPIALGIIFFALITPVSIIARLLGRDELRLKPRSVPSYWVLRQTPALDPNSFKQQF